MLFLSFCEQCERTLVAVVCLQYVHIECVCLIQRFDTVGWVTGEHLAL